MLEQAVYARRNHTAILAVAFALLCSTPAQAAGIKVGLTDEVGSVIPSADGGAWVTSSRYVARIRPDGRVTRDPQGAQLHGKLGPDGQAYLLGDPFRMLRVDGEGAVTPIALAPAGGAGVGLVELLGTGPDGTLWATTSDRKQFAHVTPAGAVTYVPGTRATRCGDFWPNQYGFVRASDGALWIADCQRLSRDGRVTELVGGAYWLAPDAAGGVWFLLIGDHALGHATVDGQVTYRVLTPRPHGLAAAPDGSAWLATGDCEVTRLAPDGTTSRVRVPIAADRPFFGPDGTLWLANGKRVARFGDPDACDDQAPAVSVPRRIAFGKRLRLTVPEPAIVSVTVDTGRTGESLQRRVVRRAGTLSFRIPARLWREVRGRLLVYGSVKDGEGSEEIFQFRIQVTR